MSPKTIAAVAAIAALISILVTRANNGAAPGSTVGKVLGK